MSDRIPLHNVTVYFRDDTAIEYEDIISYDANDIRIFMKALDGISYMVLIRSTNWVMIKPQSEAPPST